MSNRRILPQDSMVQGVSQQPRTVRGFSLAERQENFVPHPVLGLVRRNPSVFKGDLFDYADFGILTAHLYERSLDEKYLMVFGQQQLKVFDLDGTEYPVEDTSANVPVATEEGFGYLDFRKTTTDASGMVRYNNDIIPNYSDGLPLTTSNLTRTVTTDVGPLGYSVWKKFEFIAAGPATGIFVYAPTSATSVSLDTGAFSEAKEYLSCYVKLDASGPSIFQLEWSESTGTPWSGGAYYDWDGANLTQNVGLSASEVTTGYDDLGGGVFRIWAVLDVASVAAIAPGDAMAITVGGTGTSGEYFHAWGLVRQIGDETHYPYQESAHDLKTLTLGDTTILVNPHVALNEAADQTSTIPGTFGVYDFTAGVQSSIQDVLYVQLIEGQWDTQYRIAVGNSIAEPVEITVNTSDGTGTVSNKPDIYVISIDTPTVSATPWVVTVQGAACSYTFASGGTGDDKRAIAYGLANAINNNVATSVTAKATWEGTLVLEGPLAIAATVALTSKPAAGAWTLTTQQAFATGGALDSNKVMDIAQEFANKFEAQTPASWRNTLHCGRIGESTLYFYSTQPIDYFHVQDSRSDSLMRGIYREVRTFDELPVRAHHGARFKVTLADETEAAEDVGYFVKYVASAEETDQGVNGEYEESTAYSIPYKLDGTTFPHRVIPRLYDKDGNLYDGTAASGTPGALYFEFARCDWEDRLVGDLDLSPWPSGMLPELNPRGSYQDLFYAKGRLGFVAGGSVDLSEVSRYFSFFRTTNRTLLDSDPFSVTPAHPGIDIVHTAIPFAERLVLVANNAQMLLSGEPFSARTVNIDPFVNLEVDTGVLPLAHKRSLFFVAPKAGYLGVREVFPKDQEIQEADRAIQIPQYIPEGSEQFISDARGEFFLLRAGGRMFLYAHLRESGDILQSAWSELTFTAEDEVIFSDFAEDQLVFIIKRGGEVHLEQMSFVFDETAGSADFMFYMDRLTTATFVSYDGGLDETSMTIPWAIPTGATVLAIRADGTAVTVNEGAPGSTNIVVAGDQTGQTIYAGLSYNSDYEFTTPVAREFSGRSYEPSISAGVHLLFCRVALRDSMALDALVSTTDSATTTESFSETSPTDAEWEFAVMAPTEETSVILRASGNLPANLIRAEWDANLTNRGTRRRT